MNPLLYPASPAGIRPELLTPTAAFKQQVGKVIFAIILFFMVYLLLVLAAIALAAGCFYLGGLIIVYFTHIFTILLGLGLMALGVSVVFFLIKFVFAVSSKGNPSHVAITEADQPELFAFIRQVTTETKTPFPKKIYLSPEVNASVFYHSSFWSMFLPVRKNLEIGLGLVNSVNISEFKAVMAHEFGHFSQRSMKLGSFTYNVNQVIYNMLYENDGYTSFLRSWASISGQTAILASLTVRIAAGIQWVLRRMYRVVNRSYMALSREMEFHADAVAASVSGGNNLVAALARIEMAADCYNHTLKTAGTFLKEQKAFKNLFENQLTIFRSFAQTHQLPVKNGIPEISFQFIRSFSTSRVHYKDQWASHPTLEERKASLEKLAIEVAPDERSAWLLFLNSSQWQERLTAAIYQATSTEQRTEQVTGAHFEEWYAQENETSRLPAAYRGFYNNRLIQVKDWNLATLCRQQTDRDFDTLFNEQNSRLQSTINSNENDLNTLQAIQQRQLDVRSFDFDGRKHNRDACAAIIRQLETETTRLREELNQLDEAAFCFFYQQADSQEQEHLKEAYLQYQEQDKRLTQFVETANGVMQTIQPFYETQLSLEAIQRRIHELKTRSERDLKNELRYFINHGILTEHTRADLKQRIKSFNSKDYAYFIDGEFQDAELTELRSLAVEVANELGDQRYQQFRMLLDLQLRINNGKADTMAD